MSKLAIFSPGPSYHNQEVRQVAGWVGILDMYKQGLEELGYDVFIPQISEWPGYDPQESVAASIGTPAEAINKEATVAKILAYDTLAAAQLPKDASLFLGPPGYSLNQIAVFRQGLSQFVCTGANEGRTDVVGEWKRVFLYVWNNADWYRDQMLIPEYTKFQHPYDTSPTWRWINRRALTIADHVIACSPWVKKTHARIVPEEKISMTPWGVNSVTFNPPETPPPETPLRVLFVGGDPIRKGLVYLAQAVMEVPDIELWVAGCPWPFGKTPIDNRVKSIGPVPYSEMPALMQQCHVICIPTLEDGIACALQEGMACGLVPIATPEAAEVFSDMGWIKDALNSVIMHEKVEFWQNTIGFTVGYRQVEPLKQALEMLRDDQALRESMSQQAVKCAQATNWDDTKESFKQVVSEKGQVYWG